jgi:hypothetical protein
MDNKEVHFFSYKEYLGCGGKKDKFPQGPVCLGISLAVGCKAEIIQPTFFPKPSDFNEKPSNANFKFILTCHYREIGLLIITNY